MSSYFVNSTFPVTLASGQESFLGQLPLLVRLCGPSEVLPCALRARPGQDKGFAASSYCPPAGGGYGRAAPRDQLGRPAFYREKESACALSGADEPPPFHPEPREVRLRADTRASSARPRSRSAPLRSTLDAADEFMQCAGDLLRPPRPPWAPSPRVRTREPPPYLPRRKPSRAGA